MRLVNIQCYQELNKINERVLNRAEGFKTKNNDKVPSWKKKKLIAMRKGDLRDRVINKHNKRDLFKSEGVLILKEKFGDRLILKQNYRDKILQSSKQVKKDWEKPANPESELSSESEEKPEIKRWKHDKYEKL